MGWTSRAKKWGKKQVKKNVQRIARPVRKQARKHGRKLAKRAFVYGSTAVASYYGGPAAGIAANKASKEVVS